MAIAGRRQLEPGFAGELCACAALKSSAIHKGFPAVLPCPDTNLFRQNFCEPETDDSSCDLRCAGRRRAVARQGRQAGKRRNSAVSGGLQLAPSGYAGKREIFSCSEDKFSYTLCISRKFVNATRKKSRSPGISSYYKQAPGYKKRIILLPVSNKRPYSIVPYL